MRALPCWRMMSAGCGTSEVRPAAARPLASGTLAMKEVAGSPLSLPSLCQFQAALHLQLSTNRQLPLQDLQWVEPDDQGCRLMCVRAAVSTIDWSDPVSYRKLIQLPLAFVAVPNRNRLRCKFCCVDVKNTTRAQNDHVRHSKKHQRLAPSVSSNVPPHHHSRLNALNHLRFFIHNHNHFKQSE